MILDNLTKWTRGKTATENLLIIKILDCTIFQVWVKNFDTLKKGLNACSLGTYTLIGKYLIKFLSIVKENYSSRYLHFFLPLFFWVLCLSYRKEKLIRLAKLFVDWRSYLSNLNNDIKLFIFIKTRLSNWINSKPGFKSRVGFRVLFLNNTL